MFSVLVAAFVLASGGEAAESWSCTNQVEVWCDAKSCTVRPPDEMTPLSVGLGPGARFGVCAYSGCWEGSGRVHRQDGRILLTAEDVPFSTSQGGGGTDVSLLIVTADGSGFVRAGGLATPLLCRRAQPAEE